MSEGHKPLVSFLVIAYNQERYVRDAVLGAFAQTYEPLEIVLSDDCSSDRTYEIMCEMAAEYTGPASVRVRRNSQNIGLAGHINKVVAEASAEYIVWAAGDDVSLPERTVFSVDPMLKSEGVYGVHSSVIEMGLDGSLGKVWPVLDGVRNVSLEGVCSKGHAVASQTHAFRKSVFDKFGPLMPELSNEGPVMAFRELLLGDVVFIDRPLVQYRVGSGVSTYSGKDLRRTKYLEPVKISNWKRTAFKQMQLDLAAADIALPSQLEADLNANAVKYFRLWSINRKERVFYNALRVFVSNPFDRDLFKALFRLYSPSFIYLIYLKGSSRS